MSMTNNGGGGNGPAEAPAQPQMNVLGQYIKDFSFENPNTPRGSTQQPTINLQFNVSPRQVSPTDFEVVLKIEGKAEAQSTVLFMFDLSYAGLFRLQNIPQEHVAPILMIECPRLLFPFSREIISNTTVQGGFPPLLLDPVDFAAMYQQRLAAQAQAQPTTTQA
jgi:preprotein translocase subunit SecB